MCKRFMAAIDLQSFGFVEPCSGSVESPLFWINRAGITDGLDERFLINRGCTYPYFVIQYISQGAMNVIYKGREQKAGTGQLILLDAFEPHQYQALRGEKTTVHWIEFAGGDSQKLMHRIISAFSPVAGLAGGKLAKAYLHCIFRLLLRKEQKNKLLISKLIYSMLLGLLYHDRTETAGEFLLQKPGALDKALEYITTHLNEDLSIEILSGICNFNPSYFARLFHKTIGMTPAAYIRGQRTNRAKLLLADNDIRLEHISETLGFCNTSHFIRIFKNAEGMTPAEYRRQCHMYKLQG